MEKLIIDEHELIPFKSGLEAELFLYKKDNKILIVKKYPNNTNMKDIINKALLLEKYDIKNITNPKYIGVINNKENSIIMDYKENYLEANLMKKLFDLEEKILLLKKLYEILEEFYKNGLVYLDLNPKNILIKETELCLCDTLNFKESDIFDKSRFTLFAIYFLNKEINYTNNLKNDVIPYLELVINDFFNKQNTLNLIGVTDNPECMNIAYKLIKGDIVEENILDYLNLECLKQK